MNPETHTDIDTVNITANTNSSDSIPAHDTEIVDDLHPPNMYDVIVLKAERNEVLY